MRISDWSSDVCSSDLISGRLSWADDMFGITLAGSHMKFEQQTDNSEPRYDATGLNNLSNAKYIIEREINSLSGKLEFAPADGQIGRAACRERVCQYV